MASRFFNPGHPTTDKSLGDLLRWRLSRKGAVQSAAPPSRQVVPAARVEGLSVTMIGHASLLIQAAGRNLLVDPVWSERVSPIAWAGPRRVNAPGIAFDTLPRIDTILLTHNHYDHLDLATLKRLWDRDRPRILAPLGNDAVVCARPSGDRGRDPRLGRRHRPRRHDGEPDTRRPLVGARAWRSAHGAVVRLCRRLARRRDLPLGRYRLRRRPHLSRGRTALPAPRRRHPADRRLCAARLHAGPARRPRRGRPDHAGLPRGTRARHALGHVPP